MRWVLWKAGRTAPGAEWDAQTQAQDAYEKQNPATSAIADLVTPIPSPLEAGLELGKAGASAAAKAVPAITGRVADASKIASGVQELSHRIDQANDLSQIWDASKGSSVPDSQPPLSGNFRGDFSGTQVGPLDSSGMTAGAMPDSPFANRFGVFGNPSLPSDDSMDGDGPSFAPPASAPDATAGVAGAKAQAAFDQSPLPSVNLTSPDYMANDWSSPAGPKVYGDVNLNPDTYGGGYDPANIPIS